MQLLAFCIPDASSSLLHRACTVVTGPLAIVFVAAVMLTLVLPSFFTLLVFRTAYIETEATNFTIREVCAAKPCFSMAP